MSAGKGKVQKALRIFWAHEDHSTYDAAVAKIPAAQRVHVQLEALGMPKAWWSSASLRSLQRWRQLRVSGHEEMSEKNIVQLHSETVPLMWAL